MIDEDELDEVEEGLVDLAMRGWRTLDEHPLDPRSKRVQLEHNELSTLPKTIGTLEFMWKLDVSHNRLEALPRTIGKCTRLRILNVDHNYLEDIPKVRSRRPVVLGWFHFVDVTRVHLTMPWVVSFWISRPFGPRSTGDAPRRNSGAASSSRSSTPSTTLSLLFLQH
jgi:Leucine-rich repeat (LRR) protein